MDVAEHNPNELPFRYRAMVMPLRKGEAPTADRWIRMLASTADLDRHKERVHARATENGRGMHLAHHLSAGCFTDEHDIRVKDHEGKIVNVIPAAKVGEPRALVNAASALSMTERGPIVTGTLYVGDDSHEHTCMCDGCRADRWWFLLETLERSGARRRVGASVDGAVVHRTQAEDGTKDVWESWVQDIALTLSPINTSTWVEIVKSMNAWIETSSRLEKAAVRDLSVNFPMDPALAAFTDPTGTISDRAAVDYLVKARGFDRRIAEWTAREIFARAGAL